MVTVCIQDFPCRILVRSQLLWQVTFEGAYCSAIFWSLANEDDGVVARYGVPVRGTTRKCRRCIKCRHRMLLRKLATALKGAYFPTLIMDSGQCCTVQLQFQPPWRLVQFSHLSDQISGFQNWPEDCIDLETWKAAVGFRCRSAYLQKYYKMLWDLVSLGLFWRWMLLWNVWGNHVMNVHFQWNQSCIGKQVELFTFKNYGNPKSSVTFNEEWEGH